MHSLPDFLEDLKQTLLKEKNKQAAWNIIDEYFGWMDLESIQEELWILTKGTLTNDLMEQSEKGVNRHDLIFGYEFLLLFIEAVDWLHDKRIKKQKKKIE